MTAHTFRIFITATVAFQRLPCKQHAANIDDTVTYIDVADVQYYTATTAVKDPDDNTVTIGTIPNSGTNF